MPLHTQTLKTRKKHSVFDTRTLFRAKMLHSRSSKIVNLPQFLTLEPRFVERVAAGPTKLAKNLQFLTLQHHFVRKDCRGQLKSANLSQFFDLNLILCERVATLWHLISTARRLKRENKKERRRETVPKGKGRERERDRERETERERE